MSPATSKVEVRGGDEFPAAPNFWLKVKIGLGIHRYRLGMALNVIIQRAPGLYDRRTVCSYD
jgi:hypothetical protein